MSIKTYPNAIEKTRAMIREREPDRITHFASLSFPRFPSNEDLIHHRPKSILENQEKRLQGEPDLKHIDNRLKKRRDPVTGPYFRFLGDPDNPNGASFYFYLGSDFEPGLRRCFVDEINSDWFGDEPTYDPGHSGWFADLDQDETIRGLIFKLPKSRGFLAGWSMGPGMASEIDTGTVFDSAYDAACSADSLAENIAEKQRDFSERDTIARQIDETLDDEIKEWTRKKNEGFQDPDFEADEVLSEIVIVCGPDREHQYSLDELEPRLADLEEEFGMTLQPRFDELKTLLESLEMDEDLELVT